MRNFPIKNVHCMPHPLFKIAPTFPNIVPRPYDSNVPKKMFTQCSVVTINHVIAITKSIYEKKKEKKFYGSA